MNIYATFNEAGFATGFYPSDVFPDVLDENGEFVSRNESIPVDAIEVTEEERNNFVTRPQFWRLVNGKVEAFEPEEPVPARVSRAQGKIQLKRAGIWPQVMSLVNQDETGELEVWLNDAEYWLRDSPYVAQMAAALNLQKETIDQLFKDASKISAA